MRLESRANQLTKASNRKFPPVIIGVFGSVLLAYTHVLYNHFDVSLPVATFLYMLSAFIIVSSAWAFNEAWWHYRTLKAAFEPPEPPPPRDMPTGRPTFESETRPPPMMVQTAPNQWLLSKYRNITMRQWRMFYDALVMYGGLFSRDYSVKSSGIFKAGETDIIYGQAGVYAELRDDFERMELIEKRGGSWYLTDDGWRRIKEMAGIPH